MKFDQIVKTQPKSKLSAAQVVQDARNMQNQTELLSPKSKRPIKLSSEQMNK